MTSREKSLAKIDAAIERADEAIRGATAFIYLSAGTIIALNLAAALLLIFGGR